MDVLIKFKEYIQNQLKKQKRELAILEEQLNKKTRISEFLRKFKINEFNKKYIDEFVSFGLFNNIAKFQEDLELVENIDKILNELDKEDFDLKYVINILNSINIEEKDDIISNLSTIKTVLNIIDDNFSDETLKDEINLKYNETLNLLYENKKKVVDYLYENIQITLSNYVTKNHTISNYYKVEMEKLINDLEKYDKLFNASEILRPFDSAEMMNKFFQFLKESSLEKREIIELLELFIKYNFKNYQNLVMLINSTIIESVDNNRNLVHDEFRKAINATKDENIQNDDDQEDKSFELTEEEKQIYEQIKQLMTIHSLEVEEEDIIFLEEYQEISIESRKKMYLESETIDWSLVILDIKNNLLPNLETNKTDIIEIFKAIIAKNAKIENNKIKLEEKKNKLKELNETINSYLIEFEQDIIYFNSLSDSQKNFYNSIIDMIKSKQSEEIIYQNASSVSKDPMWFKNLGYLFELKDYIPLIKESLNNSKIENLELLINIISNIIEQYENFRQSFINHNEIEFSEESDVPSIEDRKNLVIYGIDSDEISSYDEEMQTKLRNCVNLLYDEKWSTLRKRNPDHMIENIRYNAPNGMQREYDEKFEPYRLKMKKIDSVRIGVIKINICKENVDKINRRYGLKFECNSLFIIINVIKTNADNHYNYKEFNDYIRKNKVNLDYIADIFGDPKADERELFKIIDENLNVNLKSSQKTGGE